MRVGSDAADHAAPSEPWGGLSFVLLGVRQSMAFTMHISFNSICSILNGFFPPASAPTISRSMSVQEKQTHWKASMNEIEL